MRYFEIEHKDYDQRGVYESDCPNCSYCMRLRTQWDHEPEYYTKITIECTNCDTGQIEFNLPVN